LFERRKEKRGKMFNAIKNFVKGVCTDMASEAMDKIKENPRKAIGGAFDILKELFIGWAESTMEKEDEEPKKKAAKKSEDDEEPKKKAKKSEDEDEEPKKKAKKSDDDDEEPKKKKKVIEDDDEEPKKAKKKVIEDDDEEPKKAKKKDDDEEPKYSKSDAAILEAFLEGGTLKEVKKKAAELFEEKGAKGEFTDVWKEWQAPPDRFAKYGYYLDKDESEEPNVYKAKKLKKKE
jgi:outer membrane biosynthesis protein TonB